jgi:hypothetical protein
MSRTPAAISRLTLQSCDDDVTRGAIMPAAADSPNPVRTQASPTLGIRPRPTLDGLVVNGPQRWPWFEDEDERANHTPR